MKTRYVFDTGALVAAERKKRRIDGFFQLVQAGVADILVPLPVIAEWWRGRTDVREQILAATQVIATIEIAKAAGVALAKCKRVHGPLTVDAMVMATAALCDGIVITQDPRDFAELESFFPAVVVLSV